ncbi:hypothetical protein [Protaetiibacter intestinalis]|uniref:hypothetical protein n=1 Tax=Protaetiibacter intestinalis TaxID=2419774 RepID=UPI001D052DEE|nr:hypothetical protein [Protaetiibacter intestinalis]
MNAAAFTPEFERFTAEQIGVAPQVSELRIASSRVRASSVVFTLTQRMCDCDSLIGRGSDDPVDGEIATEDWLTWLRELPTQVPHASRLAVLRAWSPQDDDVAPRHAKAVTISEVTEQVLRGLKDDSLLTIDYPRTA